MNLRENSRVQHYFAIASKIIVIFDQSDRVIDVFQGYTRREAHPDLVKETAARIQTVI